MASLNVTARVMQQKGTKLYLFDLNSAVLGKLAYVTPRSEESDPEEVQRIVNKKRAKEIGEYIKEPDSLLPTSVVVNLNDTVEINATEHDHVVTITFPDDNPDSDKRYAYVLDGQHRLKGFDHSDGIHFDLPIVAIHNADDALRAKIFVDINSKQVKVSKVHVASLGYQFGYLEEEESKAMTIVEKLNEDLDSPLKGKVKIFDEQKGTWITNVKLAEFIKPHVSSGGKLLGHTPAQQAKILKEFFAGIAQTWPGAWAMKKHRLSAPLGIEVLLDVFPELKNRCDLHHGGQYTADTFASAMAPLQEAEIALPGGQEVTLTWEAGDMQLFGNQAMRGLLVKRLKDILNQADQDLIASEG